jgi:hypothetical protein
MLPVYHSCRILKQAFNAYPMLFYYGGNNVYYLGKGVENLLFNFGLKQKTVKELRKNQGMTARELAQRLKLNTAAILRIDDMKLKEVPEPLRSRITPILRGDDVDKIPWL